jgi:hypothetical protein
MQSRNNTQQSQSYNQQNQNPNVGTTTNDVKANLDSVLEMSTDKRNVKTRGGKRKRFNAPTQSSDMTESSSTTQ